MGYRRRVGHQSRSRSNRGSDCSNDSSNRSNESSCSSCSSCNSSSSSSDDQNQNRRMAAATETDSNELLAMSFVRKWKKEFGACLLKGSGAG